MSYEVSLLVFGILLLILGLVGKIQAKELEVGTSSIIVRVIITLVGSVLIILSFQPDIVKDFFNSKSIPNIKPEEEAKSQSLNISDITVMNGKSYIVKDGLKNGDKIYTDRGYTYTSIPAFLQGKTYILTANEDKFSKDEKFLSFSVNTDVTVYIAHSRKYEKKPPWLLANFIKTGESLAGAGHSSGHFILDIYEGNFPKGKIILGGNLPLHENRNHAMYTIIISKS